MSLLCKLDMLVMASAAHAKMGADRRDAGGNGLFHFYQVGMNKVFLSCAHRGQDLLTGEHVRNKYCISVRVGQSITAVDKLLNR